jgi:hypothetical protein
MWRTASEGGPYKYLDAWAIPPYLSGMRHRPTFNRSYARRVLLCSLLVLCLLATPLCSARCATQACTTPNSNGASTGCHESSDTSDQTGWKVLAPKAKCTNSEILFTETRHDGLLTFSSHFSLAWPPPLGLVSRRTNGISASESVGELIVPHPAALSSAVPLRI